MDFSQKQDREKQNFFQFQFQSTFIPEAEQKVQVAVAALSLASAVLKVEQQLQKAVVVSDCYRVVDWLLVEG